MHKLKLPIWLIVLFSLYIFPIVGTRFVIISYSIIYGIPIVYLFVHLRTLLVLFGRIKVQYIMDICIFALLLMASMTIPVLHDTRDYTYIWTVLGILRKLIIYLFLTIIIIRYYFKENVMFCFMKLHIIATSVYVICSVIFFAFPMLKTIWNHIWQFENFSFLGKYGYSLRFGWGGFSGFRATITCTLSVIFLLYLKFDPLFRDFRIFTHTWSILLGINILGNMFYGRSGVIASGLICFLALVIYKKINARLVTSIVLMTGVLFFVITGLAQVNTSIHDWYNWVSSPILSFIKTGKTNNYSFNHLVNDMIFFPEWKTFLWGDGYYTDPSTGLYYRGTDSGFMRQILFWGIGATILVYVYAVYNLRSFFIRNGWKFVFLLLISFAIYEFKGEEYYEIVPLFFMLSLMFDWRKRYVQKVSQDKVSKRQMIMREGAAISDKRHYEYL